MRTQRRRRPTSVRPTLEPCESKVLLSTVAVPLDVSAGPAAASIGIQIFEDTSRSIISIQAVTIQSTV